MSKSVASSQASYKSEVYQRYKLEEEECVSPELVPLLYKYSLLWTKPRLLQCDVIIQVGKLSSGKVGDKFEAFVGVSFELDMSDQCLWRHKKQLMFKLQQ